jgi:predicted SprT family Zn-dependent metalloprotease
MISAALKSPSSKQPFPSMPGMRIPDDLPTRQIYSAVQQAFHEFDRVLYSGRLSRHRCIFTLQRYSCAYGFFAPERFANATGEIAHEFALNPKYFRDRPLIDLLSTIAHEITHLWQHHNGKPGRRGYHNRQWANEMLRIGLHPSDTGQQGGKMVGERVSHYIIPGGGFEAAANELLASGWTVSWMDAYVPPPSDKSGAEPNPTRSGRRVMYRCGTCGDRAWGKDSLRMLCLRCSTEFLPIDHHRRRLSAAA